MHHQNDNFKPILAVFVVSAMGLMATQIANATASDTRC